MSYVAVTYALAAALLFGLSTPAAKILVGAVDPWMLAGLFYLGSGFGLGAWRAGRALAGRRPESSLTVRDLPWLAGAIAAGGVVGPILLMIGLVRVEASAASLLLTLEGVATALMAWFLFRENFDRRVALGMGSIAAGAAVLAWQGGFSLSGLAGPAAIVGACIAWGVDNNLTRRVSLADPVEIAMVKGLVAGPVNVVLALIQGAALPGWDTASAAGIVGLLGYGVSLVLFVLALRHLGAARTGAYFSTAPFLGALAAIAMLGEPVSARLFLAGILMGIGVYLHLTERHVHAHEHEATTHSHRHSHDIHHQHVHSPDDPPGEPHTHSHAHVRLLHSHAHAPDMHHRHGH
jgi:drug/metabolite transporter (DMT)-like permease